MRISSLLLITLLLSGCEFWFDNFTKQGEVAVYLSSSPRAELSGVTLTITQIEIQHSAGQWHTLDISSNINQKNLQHVSSDAPLLMAQQENLPEGEYTRLRVSFNTPAGETIARDSGGLFNLYAANTLSVDITPRFKINKDQKRDLLATLDFQRALAEYEDDNEWYYRLETQALRVTPRNEGYIYGNITDAAWQPLDCNEAEFSDNNERLGGYVYVYQDKQQELHKLTDLQLDNDQAPIATAAVIADESDSSKQQYRFSPLPEGDYIVAITCHGERDHPSGHNNDVLISTGKKLSVTGTSNQRMDFN